MSIKLKVEIDPAKITKAHKLDDKGAGELFIATELKRLCTPYVPWRTGVLNNTAEVTPGQVEYVQPYAKRQYYEHKGNGLRGPQWDRRMIAQRREELVRSVAAFLGGRSG